MKPRGHYKLQLCLENEAEWCEHNFALRMRVLRTRLDNPVRFWSGERIIAGFDAIKAALVEFGQFALELVDRGARDPGQIEIACGALDAFWLRMQGWVPIIVWPPDGKALPGHDELNDEVNIHLEMMRRDVDARIAQIRRHAGDVSPSAGATHHGYNVLGNGPLGSLPLWLNMFQACAWVVFRTERAMAALDRASLLHCEIRFSSTPQFGSLDDLEIALQAGRPVAEGISKGNVTVPVPKSFWASMPIAPILPESEAAYRNVVIRRDILVSAFPKLDVLAARERRSKPKLSSAQLGDWFDGLGARQSLAQSELYRLACVDFPDSQVTHAEIRQLTPGRLRGRKAKFK